MHPTANSAALKLYHPARRVLGEADADEAGNLRAYCLEVHDTCVSKLMAGRGKDFAFIKELPDRGLVEMETLIDRAGLVADMPRRGFD